MIDAILCTNTFKKNIMYILIGLIRPPPPLFPSPLYHHHYHHFHNHH